MASEGLGLLILLIATTGCFLIGLLFWGKLKVARRFFWGLGVFLILWTVLVLMDGPLLNRRIAREWAGEYRINLQESIYQEDSLSKFSGLILTVKDDNTFSLNKPTPFFISISGKWRYKDDGDLAYTECSFDGTNDWSFIGANFANWTFECCGALEGKNGDLIVFTRKQ